MCEIKSEILSSSCEKVSFYVIHTKKGKTKKLTVKVSIGLGRLPGHTVSLIDIQIQRIYFASSYHRVDMMLYDNFSV